MSYSENPKVDSLHASGGYNGFSATLYGEWTFDQDVVVEGINANGVVTASNISGTNTGDQDLSPLTTGSYAITAGTATLVAGVVTVSEAAVTTASKILLTASSTSTGLGLMRTGNIVNATSFDITSLNVLDDATVDYLIVTPI
jgi:hypothetical protein